MKIDKTEVYGFGAAVRGMRNPMNSWDKSDSYKYLDKIEDINDIHAIENSNVEGFVLGSNDLDLAQRLIKAGSEHCKFLRFIQVWADWELPLYVWKEADTYKFIEKNSCSTMHKITSRMLTMEDFETEYYSDGQIENILDYINLLILDFKEEENKDSKESIFRGIIQLLPSSYLQKRTIITNYAELRNIYKQRQHHRLPEWHKICEWIESLPYSKELITYGL